MRIGGCIETGRLRGGLRRLPRGLVGTIGLVLLVESIVAHVGPGLASSGPWDWARAKDRAGRAAPGCDVLCFGDSQMKLGAVPRVIEARTGRRTFNLALVGGQVPAATVLLRRSLDAGARPSAVLLNMLPPLLYAGVDRNARQWPELLDLGECAELARTGRDPALFARLVLARVLPSVRARLDIRAGVLAALAGRAASKPEELAMHRRNWAFNRGTMLVPDYGGTHDMALWYRANYAGDWQPDPTNAIYLLRFLRLAAAHGITVYWLLAPIDPEAQALTEAGGQDARFERFVRDVQARFANVVVIDGRRAGYGREAFTDEVHLHTGGAYALSEALAEVLGPGADPAAGSPAAAGPGGRWVALPPFRPRTIDVPVEDLNQSLLAVRSAEGRRR